MCGICSFSTNEIHLLEDHVESFHQCTTCGETFNEKRFHYCVPRRPLFQRGLGVGIKIPLDATNKPVFVLKASAFKDTIATYTHDFRDTGLNDAIEATHTIINPLLDLARQYLLKHKGIRIKLLFRMLLNSPKDGKDVEKQYPSAPMKVMHENFLRDTIMNCATYVSRLAVLLSHEISGLNLKRILSTDISIIKYRPKLAEGSLPLPGDLANRHGLINVLNDGNCFLYAVCCSLYYKSIVNEAGDNIETAKGTARQALKRKLAKPSTYHSYARSIKCPREVYSDDMSPVDEFENLNTDISVSILRYSSAAKEIVPLRLTKVMRPRHVFLLLISRHQIMKDLKKNGGEKRLRRQKSFTAEYHFLSIYNISAFMAAKSNKFLGVCRFCFGKYRIIDHETRCFQNDYANLVLPVNERYKYNELWRMCLPPTWFVYQLLFTGDKANLNISGFSLLGLNSKFEIKYKTTYLGEDAIQVFFDSLLVNSYYFMDVDERSHIPLRPKKEDYENIKRVKNCYICGSVPTEKNRIVMHHDHFSDLVNGERVPGHCAGNVLSFPCSNCNLLMKHRGRVMVYGFNLSLHAKYFLPYLSERGVQSLFVSPMKSAEQYGSLTINRKIQFVDLSYHFNTENLHDILPTVDDDDLFLLQNVSKDEIEFSFMRKGLPYPCTTREDKLPSFERFTDYRNLNNFTREHYDNAVQAFAYMSCVNLREYASKSLETDVYMMGSLMIQYVKFCQKTFHLHPMYDISLSSFSYAALHYTSKTNYETLRDGRIITMLENSILPGVSTSNSRYETFDSKSGTECLWIDCVQQFTSITAKHMPYEGYKLWSREEIAQFNIDAIEDSSDTWYIIKCNMKYPNVYVLQVYVTGTKEKIDLSCRDKENVFFSHRNLKLFISLGIKLISISEIISYKVSNHLKPFAQICMEKRQTAKNSFFKQIAKSVCNLAIGKFQQKRDNTRVVLPVTQKAAERLLSKNLFVDACPLSESCAAVYMNRKRSLEAKNILMSYHVLQESCYMLYSLFYTKIKSIWGESAYLLYAQTDSMVIRLRNIKNFYKDLQQFKDIFDFSLSPELKFLNDVHTTHNPCGKWRIEGLRIKEFVSLRQKSYSILQSCESADHNENDSCTFCTTCKGIRKQKISHTDYLNILKKKHPGIFAYRTLCISNDGILIKTLNRQFLGTSDGNRVWVSDFESKPLGHYSLDP